MKTKNSEPKAKVKIKNLKVVKDTIQDLSDEDAGFVKGGLTYTCGSEPGKPIKNHNETLICEEE